MALSDKETVALAEDEFEILDALRRAAPRHGISPKLAQAYGAWTVCFRRYCQEQDRPWLWMSSVSDFMDFLEAHPKVSETERDRALDGIMFYITDVHAAQQKEEPDDARGTSSVPRSTQSLFAQMLLRCDVQLSEALHLRRDDVRLEEATIHFPGTENRDPRTVTLPTTLHKGFQHHLRRVNDRTTTSNPPLFGPFEPTSRPAPAADPGTDEDLDRSTELATRVMRTFGEQPDAGDDAA
jgi:hypothetical protein